MYEQESDVREIGHQDGLNPPMQITAPASVELVAREK